MKQLAPLVDYATGQQLAPLLGEGEMALVGQQLAPLLGEGEVPLVGQRRKL